MNFCKSDIYFIIVLLLITYLYFNPIKNEGFQATTNSGYLADIESIRNLSNIAIQLTTNNALTMPGDLKITNNLVVRSGKEANQVQIGESEIKFRGDGKAHYSIFNTNGTFKISNTSGLATLSGGLVNDSLVIDTAGNISISGNINANQLNLNKIKLGTWTIKDNNGILEFIQDSTKYSSTYTSLTNGQGFVAFGKDGDIYKNSSGFNGWLNASLPLFVRTDKSYESIFGTGNYLWDSNNDTVNKETYNSWKPNKIDNYKSTTVTFKPV